MPRGYRRKRRNNKKRLIVITAVPLMLLSLALAWVWKSNMVKEYHSAMRKLETEKTNLIAENMRIRAELMDLKSISQINNVVTKEFGLTQNVSQRIFLADPVKRKKTESKMDFVDKGHIPDWLETAVVGSGRVYAEPDSQETARDDSE